MSGQSLPRPFMIEFNGKFVTNPRNNDEMAVNGRIPASVGDRADAAVFEFHDGYLRKAGGFDSIHFGRFIVEPLVLMPMPVYWIPTRQMVVPCSFIGDESEPRAFESRGFNIGVLPGEENLVRAVPPHQYPESEMKIHWQ